MPSEITYYMNRVSELRRERDEAWANAKAYGDMLDGVVEQHKECGEALLAAKRERDEARGEVQTLRAALERIEATDCGDFPQGWEQDGCLEAVRRMHRIALDALAALGREDEGTT